MTEIQRKQVITIWVKLTESEIWTATGNFLSISANSMSISFPRVSSKGDSVWMPGLAELSYSSSSTSSFFGGPNIFPNKRNKKQIVHANYWNIDTIYSLYHLTLVVMAICSHRISCLSKWLYMDSTVCRHVPKKKNANTFRLCFWTFLVP